MSDLPKNLKYTENHEWASRNEGVVTLGISDHAQRQLGDIVYLELPEEGSEITKTNPFGVVESVKAVSDLFAPISGEVVCANTNLVDEPEGINQSPYDKGWMIKIRESNPNEFDSLMSVSEYSEFLAKEAK